MTLQSWRILFDGGSLNNPGRGYGSYEIRGPDLPPRVERLDFGDGVTNNEAEYRALLAGLEDLRRLLQRRGVAPGEVALTVQGDSQLVINQLAGRWRVRTPHLRALHERAR
ncbi:MAG TPA: ribonuclease HI family protein, partial [Chloroflexota bacterium]